MQKSNTFFTAPSLPLSQNESSMTWISHVVNVSKNYSVFDHRLHFVNPNHKSFRNMLPVCHHFWWKKNLRKDLEEFSGYYLKNLWTIQRFCDTRMYRPKSITLKVIDFVSKARTCAELCLRRKIQGWIFQSILKSVIWNWFVQSKKTLHFLFKLFKK